MYLSDAIQKHPYIRKGLIEIGAYERNGISIKKECMDRSLKHKGRTYLNSKTTRKLQKAYNRFEFNDHFEVDEKTFPNGLDFVKKIQGCFLPSL